jgi:hypothetical protein
MFTVNHADGSSTEDPSLETLASLFDELASSNVEHGDVAVVDQETGWCMSAHRDSRLVLVHLGERGSQRHMIPVSKERVLELWRRLAQSDIEGILKEPWKAGYVER